jgi:hydroxymethylbilane synthase
MKPLRIATRKSRLALWQATWVRDQIVKQFPEQPVELVPMSTQGDRILDRSLSEIGGKGLFIKELEQAMLAGSADLAVHSMKDMTAHVPTGLTISVITEREDPGDAFVSNNYASLEELPQGAVVGTSSLRRMCQVRHHRPDLNVRSLRGNVETRLRKLDEGEYDAIILAVAGLKRLELDQRIAQILPQEQMLPAIAQGVIGIETRAEDHETLRWLSHLQHTDTLSCLTAERKVMAMLEGNCHVPLAGYCTLHGEELHLRARIGSPDGATLLHAESRAHRDQALALGEQVAQELLAQGGQHILDEFRPAP